MSKGNQNKTAEELYKHTATLLQKFDSMKDNPMDGFKDLQNPAGHFEDLKAEIVKGLDSLFKQSDKEDFFWYDCPLTVYERTLLTRVEYLKINEYPSITIEDLLRLDYKILFNMPRFDQRVLMTDRKELNCFQSLNYGQLLEKDKTGVGEKLELDREKKMKFIKSEFQKEGKLLEFNGKEFEITDMPTSVKTVEVAQPHSRIFSCNGFKLFEYILTNSVSVQRGRKSDIAYFYWMMYNDSNKYIIARPTPFKEWFDEMYEEYLGDKLKTLPNVQNTRRDKEYSRALNWFKQE